MRLVVRDADFNNVSRENYGFCHWRSSLQWQHILISDCNLYDYTQAGFWNYIQYKWNSVHLCLGWLFTRPFFTSGGFRVARLPGQATRTVRPLCHSWISMVSSKHNWPKFYPGNARACPGLEPAMFLTLPFFTPPIEEGSRNQTTWAVKWNNCKEYKYTTLWTV